MIEILFEVFAELIIEIVIQAIFELGGRSLAIVLRNDSTPNPWPAVCVYLAMGAVSGVISLWIFPSHILAMGLVRYFLAT